MKREVPLSAVDVEVFLAGVLVDPYSIAYEVKEPGGATATDEDGVAVSARPGFKVAEGRYSAKATVLPGSAALGTYTVEWTVQKLSTMAPIVVSRTFDVVDGEPEVADRDTTSRRDVEDTANVVRLRRLLNDQSGDETTWAFFNSELQEFIDQAIEVHTRGERTEATATADDVALSMYLAQYSAYRVLAKDATKHFRWTDGNESVDKTLTSGQLAAICKGLMDEYDRLQNRRLKEAEAGIAKQNVGDLAVFTPRRARRSRR